MSDWFEKMADAEDKYNKEHYRENAKKIKKQNEDLRLLYKCIRKIIGILKDDSPDTEKVLEIREIIGKTVTVRKGRMKLVK